MSVKILVKQLPSGKGYYGEGKNVYVKKFTYGQLVDISQAEDEYTAVLKTLEGVEADFPIEELAFADLEYCMLFRRLSAPGFEQFSVTYSCESCDADNTFLAKVEELEFMENTLTRDRLPVSVIYGEKEGERLDFMPYTVGNWLSLVKKGLNRNKLAIEASMVVNKSYEDAYKVIYEQGEEFEEIIKGLSKEFDWGVKAKDRKCKKCGFLNSVSLDGNGVLLRPKGELERTAGCRVVYGGERVCEDRGVKG